MQTLANRLRSRLKPATPHDRYKRWRTELEWWRGAACFFWGVPLILTVLICADLLLPTLGLTATTRWSMFGVGGLIQTVLFTLLVLVYLKGAKLTATVTGNISTWRFMGFVKPVYLLFLAISCAVTPACLILLSSTYPNPGFPTLLSVQSYSGHSGLGNIGLLGSGIILGALSAYQYIDKGLNVLSFPSLQKGRIFRLKRQLLPTLLDSFELSLAAPVAYLCYFVTHYLSILLSPSSLPPSVTSTPHSVPSLVPMSIFTLLHIYVISLIVIFSQRLVVHFMHIILTQWISFEGRGGGVGAEGDVVIAALEEEIKVGTTPGEEWKEYKASKASLMGALALLELAGLVRTSPRRRARIFADHTGKSWESVIAHTIGLIDSMTQRLLAATQELKDERKYMKSGKKGISGALSAAWAMFSRKFLIQPPARRTEAMLSDFLLVIWSIQALSGLVAASRDEDRYGVVQRSDGVRRTLHSLLALELALEAYCALPLPLPKAPASSISSYGYVRPHPHAITTGVESGLYQIVTVFYDHLPAFKFPPSYARRLQSFADFQQ